MKTALICDQLTGYGEQSRIIDCFLDIFPDADIFTFFLLPSAVPERIVGRVKQVSVLQKLPFWRHDPLKYRALMPWASELFELSGYDAVISISEFAAKGVITMPKTVHFTYIIGLMNCAWEYGNAPGIYSGIKGIIRSMTGTYLRLWDTVSTKRCDYMIASSGYIKEKIAKYYDINADTILPPVDTERFGKAGPAGEGEYYLIRSALIRQKDLRYALRTFAANGKPLLVTRTDHVDEYILKKAVNSPNIRFIKDPGLNDLALYGKAKAFISPGAEDIGLHLAEAAACGTPVIALNAGAAPEILNGRNGILFPKADEGSLNAALDELESSSLEETGIVSSVSHFSRDRFRNTFWEYFNLKMNAHSEIIRSVHGR